MSSAAGNNKGRKILFGVVSGVLFLLVIFMGLIYFYQEELQSFALGQMKDQITKSEPAGYTVEQIDEIFGRYSNWMKTSYDADSLSADLGDAFLGAYEDQVITREESENILGLLRELTDPMGPYNSGEPGIVDEDYPVDSMEDDSL